MNQESPHVIVIPSVLTNEDFVGDELQSVEDGLRKSLEGQVEQFLPGKLQED